MPKDRIIHEINEEAKRIYRDRYGKRSPATLSTLELDRVKTEAAQRVNKRRRGGLAK